MLGKHDSLSSPADTLKGHLSGNAVSSSSATKAPRHNPANIEDTVTAVQAKTQPGNFAYGLGVALRKLWDKTSGYVYQVWDRVSGAWNTLNKATSLPAAEAVNIRRAPAATDTLDNIIERHLAKKEGIQFLLDDSTKGIFARTDERSLKKQEIILKDLERVSEHVKKQIKLAAKEGPQTKELISSCLSNIQQIQILHPVWSKDIIKQRYKDFGGGYNPRTNTLILIPSTSVMSSIGTIIHECWHVKDTLDSEWRQGKYDVAKLDACQKNLTQLLIDTVDCFNGKQSKRCEDVKQFAKEYEHRPGTVHCDLVSSIDDNGLFGVRSMSSVNRKTKEGMVFQKVRGDSKTVCVLKPDRIQDMRTNQIRNLSAQEKQMMDMMTNLDRRSSKETIQRLYSKDDFNVEYHANTIDRVPEKILRATCPDGSEKSYWQQVAKRQKEMQVDREL